VAREATVSNAINLRRVNLIGVYGTPSERRALVRLPNGRYQKVEVGDRFDGGRVSAIGDSELRYQKSGRNVVLTMPKG
jgi:Tfp pilus assembly protein PilP